MAPLGNFLSRTSSLDASSRWSSLLRGNMTLQTVYKKAWFIFFLWSAFHSPGSMPAYLTFMLWQLCMWPISQKRNPESCCHCAQVSGPLSLPQVQDHDVNVYLEWQMRELSLCHQASIMIASSLGFHAHIYRSQRMLLSLTASFLPAMVIAYTSVLGVAEN